MGEHSLQEFHQVTIWIQPRIPWVEVGHESVDVFEFKRPRLGSAPQFVVIDNEDYLVCW